MSLRTLETLIADRLDKQVLLAGAAKVQPVSSQERYYNELMRFETNGLCLALRALMAEDACSDPDHFPSPNLISEEWRAAHRSKI